VKTKKYSDSTSHYEFTHSIETTNINRYFKCLVMQLNVMNSKQIGKGKAVPLYAMEALGGEEV
jgi:hypothetical protein